MRILALDLGNTKGMAGLLEDGRLQAWLRREREDKSSSHPLAELYEWCRAQISEAPVSGLVVSTVVPEALPLWSSLWERGESTRKLPMQLVTHETEFPFAVDLDSPQSVGSDRWCNVAGAVARGLGSALVVDLGTANTYDVLLDGCFIGGVIAPGITRSHRSLISSGSLLPELEFRAPERIIGRRTDEAIRSGSWHQGLGGVESMVERILEQQAGLPVLLTGGIGALVVDYLRIECEWVPHLTLEGAASLFVLPRD